MNPAPQLLHEQLLRIVARHMGARACKEMEDEAAARVRELLG